MEKPWKNRITGLLGCDYPILSGPMRLITLGSMAAAVSNAGGFGVVAASGLSREDLVREIKTVRSLTDRPFGVNIPVYRPNAAEALEVCIDMGVRVVYTSAGSPVKLMNTIKRAGLKVIHKVSSTDMARKAQDAGVDAVVAMGFEAGGHIGRDGITTLCLIPALVRALRVPVIASGGIGDGGGLIAALALGAQGVEVGTALVATTECPVPAFFKDAIVQSAVTATVVLGKDAMPIRVLRNVLTSRVAGMSGPEADWAIAAHGDARYVADGGTKDTAVMPCGQVVGLVSGIMSVSDLFACMITGARSILDSLGEIVNGGTR